jgi:hypothetical protein
MLGQQFLVVSDIIERKRSLENGLWKMSSMKLQAVAFTSFVN